MTSLPIQATGMVWYLAEDFGEIKTLMEDGHKLPGTYAAWKLKAEAREKFFSGQGVLVYRAILRPAEFRAWCLARGINLNAKSRQDFAAWFAAQTYQAAR
jgi:hypothetical protein